MEDNSAAETRIWESPVEKSDYLVQVYRRLREILVAIRRRRGWKQRDLASRLGVSQSFVAKYENGFRRLDVGDFLWIARTLEVDPKRIIRRIERHLLRLESKG